MATSLSLGSFTARILRRDQRAACSDQPVEVYSPSHAEGRATGYVEAVTGAAFKVALHNGSASTVVGDISIDGKLIDHIVVEPGAQRCLEGRRMSYKDVAPFVFREIVLTADEARACRDKQVIDNLGSVVIQVYEIDIAHYEVAPSQGYAEIGAAATFLESKKAFLTHSVGTTLRRSFASTTIRFTYRTETPIATLTVRYLRRDLLEANGLIRSDGMDEEHDTDVVEVTKEEFEVAVRRKRRDRELVEDVKPPKVPTLNRPPSPARNVVALHWTREVVLRDLCRLLDNIPHLRDVLPGSEAGRAILQAEASRQQPTPSRPSKRGRIMIEIDD